MDWENIFTVDDVFTFLKRKFSNVLSLVVLLLATMVFFKTDFKKETYDGYTTQDLIQRINESETTIAELKQQIYRYDNLFQRINEDERKIEDNNKTIHLSREQMERKIHDTETKIHDIETTQNQRQEDYRNDIREIMKLLQDFSTQQKLTENEVGNINKLIDLIKHAMDSDSRLHDNMRLELNRLYQLNQEIESRLRETEKKNSGYLTGLIHSIDSRISSFNNGRKQLT